LRRRSKTAGTLSSYIWITNALQVLALLLAAAPLLCAQNSYTTGRFQVEHPTLLNRGFEWLKSRQAHTIRGFLSTAKSLSYRSAAVWPERGPTTRAGSGANVCVADDIGSIAARPTLPERTRHPLAI